MRHFSGKRRQIMLVWHFSLAVSDPEKSAEFWTQNFALKEMFRSDEAIALTNDAMIIAFFKGTPHPDAIDHMSINVESVRALREALETLKNKPGGFRRRHRPHIAGLAA